MKAESAEHMPPSRASLFASLGAVSRSPWTRPYERQCPCPACNRLRAWLCIFPISGMREGVKQTLGVSESNHTPGKVPFLRANSFTPKQLLIQRSKTRHQKDCHLPGHAPHLPGIGGGVGRRGGERAHPAPDPRWQALCSVLRSVNPGTSPVRTWSAFHR